MRYVTYTELFQLLLVIIGMVGLVIDIVRSHKKK